jgi:hypothetical protein
VLASDDGIQQRARIGVLLLDPGARLGAPLILEPAIRITDLDSMEDLTNLLRRSVRRPLRALRSHPLPEGKENAEEKKSTSSV